MDPVVALLLGIVIGAGLVIFAQERQTINRRIDTLKEIQDGIEEILSRPAEEEEDDLEAPDQPALPVDPDNPPVTRRYNPRPGSAHKRCSCHDRLLEVGEDVLWWPLPDGAVRLICQDGLTGARGY